MPTDCPTDEEIIGLAQQIKVLAVRRRADELRWARKGTIPDHIDDMGAIPNRHFSAPHFRGGTTADYRRLEEGYEWIVQAFRNAIGPEPSRLDGAVHGMDAARNRLRGDTRSMSFDTVMGSGGKVRLVQRNDSIDWTPVQLKDYMLANLKNWNGSAAQTFERNFAVLLPEVIANQVLMVSALRSAVSTNRTVYAMARNDLKDLAKATIDALNFKTGSGGPSFTMTLSVTVGVLGVTAACVSGPGAIIFFTAAASTAGVVQDIVGETKSDGQPAPKGKEYEVGGHTVDMVLSNTYELIQETQKYLSMSEDTIIEGLQENFHLLTSAVTRKHFVSPRPSVADINTGLKHVRDDYVFYPD